MAIWCNEPEVAADILKEGRNERFLPGVRLPRGIGAGTDPVAVAAGKDVILLAVPSPYLMGVARQMLTAPNVMDGQSLVVVVTKGFVAGPPGSAGAQAAPRLILESLEDPRRDSTAATRSTSRGRATRRKCPEA